MRRAIFLAALVACATDNNIRIVRNFRAARERGDDTAAAAYLAPDSRMWFYKKEGPGFPLGHGGEQWRHWDIYFHGHSVLTHWQSHDGVVTAIGHEENDFYRMLDWKPAPFRNTWWFDEHGRIKEILLEPLGSPTSRLEEFKVWAAKNRPEELAYLMPKSEIDPTGDRPERWRAILEEWRGTPSQPLVRRVQAFRDAQDRGDLAAAQSYIAPGARLWYEEKKGDGEPYILGGGSWDHWDAYFHSTHRLTDWHTDGRAVTATAYETNDFMQLLEWQAPPYTITWWFNNQNRISEVLIKGGGEAKSRLEEFKAWAAKNHPDELAHLMPKGKIDPTGDRPERWRAILLEWRRTLQ